MVTTHDIETYRAKRAETVSKATVNRELSFLKHMFKKAVEWGYTKANPATPIKQLKEPPGRIRYLTHEQITALMDTLPAHLYPLVVAALNTGFRKEKLFSLTWSQVNLRNRTITLLKTKNHEPRTIYINETLLGVLTGQPRHPESDYVFCNGDGHRFKDVRQGFYSALKKIGVEGFHFHDLRHTFASHLVMRGVGIPALQILMGHRTIAMTMRYSHLSNDHLQEAVNVLDIVMKPATGATDQEQNKNN